MTTDLVERAEAAWQAGKDEVDRVAKLPRPWVLETGDDPVEQGALDSPTEELAKELDLLRDLITQARGANSAELGMTETAIEAQLGTLEAQTRDLRTLREKYQARREPNAG